MLVIRGKIIMGCKNSTKRVNIVISLDSNYFTEPEIVICKPITCSIQELLQDVRKNLSKQDDSLDLMLKFDNSTLIKDSNNTTLKDLGVYQNSRFNIIVRSEYKKIRIYIETDPPSEIYVSIKKKQTIAHLKKKIVPNTPSEEVFVLFRNIFLHDEISVAQLNLKDKEILKVLIKQENKLIP